MSRFAQGAGKLVGHIGCQLLVIAAIFFSVWAANAEADINDGLYLHYPLTQTTGTSITDASGNGRNGNVVNGTNWLGADGMQFNGGAIASGNYVTMPNNITTGLTTLTVSMDVWVDAAASTSSHFIFNIGNPGVQNQMNGHLFITPNPDFRGAITSGWWSQEQSATRTGALTRGSWRRITLSLGGGTMRLYENATQVAVNSSVTHTPAVFNNGAGTSTANYIGRAAYADPLFRGRIRDFRIYNRVLDIADVCTLSSEYVDIPATIAGDKNAIDLGNTTGVYENLTLPTSGAGGSSISWQTSNAGVVSSTGVVTRPVGSESATATLTATISFCGQSDTRQFQVTVLPLGDQADAETAAAALVVHNLGDVRGNLTLPTSGILGTSVAWASNDPAAVSNTGIVTRPPHGSAAKTVQLTATVTKGSGSHQRMFTATLPPLPPGGEDLKGYVFPYMTGEGTTNGEQVYFSLSQGNNPLQWQNLNNAQPVLTSTIGERGIRDPFIIRSPEGDKFYILATDLRMFQSSSGSWDQVERTGSKSMMIWESTDLVTWTNQRLVRVAPDSAGNVWAPEAFYDDATGQYVVFWASAIYNQQTDPNHTVATKPHQRMMFATTRDFYTFSEPQEWLNPGYRVIDSTVIKHNNTYYRFTKDEREYNATVNPPTWNVGQCGKRIFSDAMASPLTTIVNPVVTPDPVTRIADCIGNQFGAAEGPTIFKSNTENKWHLFIDYFGGGGYRAFEASSPAATTWTHSTNYQLPASPRHGTVMPVTQAEWDRLLSTYQPSAYIASIAPTVRTTTPGTAPSMPSSVTVTLGNGTTATRTVTWDSIPPSAYAQPGQFQVEGTVPNSYTVKATATVTVSAVAVTGVSVNPTSLDLDYGETQSLQATVTPANATDPLVAWDTDDDDITVVNPLAQNGHANVTAVGLGETLITASAGGGSHTAQIPVSVTAGTEIVASPVVPTTKYGSAPVLSTAVSSVSSLAPPSGTAQAWINGGLVATGSIAGGLGSLTLPADLAVGTHEVEVRFTGGGSYRNSSTTQSVVVAKSDYALSLSLSAKKVKVGKRATLKIKVTSSSGANGPLTIKVGSKTVKKNLRLKANGTATFKLPKLKKGTHKITVAFAGSATTNKAQKTVKLKVVKK